MRTAIQSLAERAATFAVSRAAKRFLTLKPATAPLGAAPDDAPRLLYMHVPFCHSLCPYCSFHKFRFHEPSAMRYFELLRREMRLVHALGYRFDALYVGGGTTTVLTDELHALIDLARELFDIEEVSCESDASHLHLLDPERIDRLSVGIQSFDDERLRMLGRFEKFGSADEQFAAVRAAVERFKSVNVDMIYNYPGQQEAELRRDLERLLELRPQQATFYPLMYAPGIERTLVQKWGRLDFEQEARYYGVIEAQMGAVYAPRSSWAWSLEHGGIIDEYVIERSEYVGIGSGAFSFVGDTLYANTFSLPEYARRIGAGEPGTTHSVRFPARAIGQYRMMVELFGLRPCEGMLRPETWLLRLCGACENGRLSPWGRYLLSAMMREFYNGMDAVRETMRKPLGKADGLIEP